MTAQWTPMRWPDSWTDPSSLDLLQGTAIDYLLIGKSEALGPVRTRAQQAGLHVADTPPAGVTTVKGEWPGVKMARGRGAAQAMGGPTGVPWVDSNGWLIRLQSALHPENSIWVDAPPDGNARIAAGSYLVAIADSASHGGRWILSLDTQLAAGLHTRTPQALDTWKNVTAAAGFFAARKTWPGYAPVGVVGVVSDFSGQNEFFSRELLNLLDRAGQHYRILIREAAAINDASFTSLRALIYFDIEPPAPGLRKQILAFVEAGGILITGPKWGELPDTPAKSDEHPRFSWRALGKGRVAVAHEDPGDPYLWANDSVVLVSHRYDLVRFWNGGATGSYYTMSPGQKQAVVHLLFYANRGPDSASVRIAGRFREVKAWTIDGPVKVEIDSQKDAVEVHLPQVSQYVALELSEPRP